mmetsp:Transcript_39522/g.113733  ORF Transcript_39522/g.113733 Transcript_39522/m.113733 type:complete len:250 (-) Transcript_39522:73-822(-)
MALVRARRAAVAGLHVQLLDLLPEVLRAQRQLLALSVERLLLPIHFHGPDHRHEPRDLALRGIVQRERGSQHLRPEWRRVLRRNCLAQQFVQARNRRRLVLGGRRLRICLPKRWVPTNGLERRLNGAALEEHLLKAHLPVAAMRHTAARTCARVFRCHLLHPIAVELSHLRRHLHSPRLVLQLRLDLDGVCAAAFDCVTRALGRRSHGMRGSLGEGLNGLALLQLGRFLADLAEGRLQPRHRSEHRGER